MKWIKDCIDSLQNSNYPTDIIVIDNGSTDQTTQFIKDNYGAFHFDCKQYDRLYEFMQHDKKNSAGVINFTLLKEIGDISINRTADKDTIFEMFDFYRECMGM